MKGRAHRRAQRDRIIARRRARFEAVTGRPFWSHAGKLAHRSGLGCPDGRACPVCRLPDERAAERRETQAAIEEQTTDGLKILDRITGDDPELQAEIQAEVELCKLREATRQHRRMAGVELRPRIVELSALKAGWMNGEGAAFDVDPYYVEQVARALEAAGMAPFWIYPTLEGGVQFEGDTWAHELVINP